MISRIIGAASILEESLNNHVQLNKLVKSNQLKMIKTTTKSIINTVKNILDEKMIELNDFNNDALISYVKQTGCIERYDHEIIFDSVISYIRNIINSIKSIIHSEPSILKIKQIFESDMLSEDKISHIHSILKVTALCK